MSRRLQSTKHIENMPQLSNKAWNDHDFWPAGKLSAIPTQPSDENDLLLIAYLLKVCQIYYTCLDDYDQQSNQKANRKKATAFQQSIERP